MAEFPLFINTNGSYSVKPDTVFFARVYNTKSLSGHPTFLESEEDITRFLEKNNFNVIELYEWKNRDELDSKPTAIIRREGDLTYVIFNMEDSKNFGSDNIYLNMCPLLYWNSGIVKMVGASIVKTRILDIPEQKHPPILPPQKSQPIITL